MRLGLVLEVTTSFQHFKHGIEIRILSSWVKITLSQGSECPMERSIMGSIQFKTIQKILQIHKKSKFHKQARVWLQSGERQKQNLNRGNLLAQQLHQYTNIEPSKQDLDSYDFSEKVINLLRLNQTVQREEDGAIEFCKIKFHLRNYHSQTQISLFGCRRRFEKKT